MAAVAGGAKLCRLLAERVEIAGLACFQSDRRTRLGLGVEISEICPDLGVGGRAGRAVSESSGLRLRRKEMREYHKQRVDPESARLEIVQRRFFSRRSNLDRH